MKSGDKISNVTSFLIGISRNLCLNYLNREKPKTISINSDISETYIENIVVAESSNYESNELFDIVAKVVDTLSDEFKEVFELREFFGLKYKEIAEICNIPLSTAKDRVYTAHEKIRKILSPYIEDLNKY